MLGEAPKLDAQASIAVARRYIERMGIPVIVGVSAPGFAAMRALARAAMEAGAGRSLNRSPPSQRTP